MIDKSLRETRSLERDRTPDSGKYLLCINFIEMIMRCRSDLLNLTDDSSSSLYLKFSFLGVNY
jgi:hypothetical protein